MRPIIAPLSALGFIMKVTVVSLRGNVVTALPSPALQVAPAYYEACSSKDIDWGLSYIAEEISCQAPAGRIEGAAAYRAFLAPFTQILTSSRMIAALGDDQTALVMYDAETVPVKNAPGAECVMVENGKITHSRFLFGRAPFDAARRAAP